MAPHNIEPTGVLFESDEVSPVLEIKSDKYKPTAKRRYAWFIIILFAYFHAVAVYGIYLLLTSAKIWTSLAVLVFHAMGVIGMTAGAHRLWSHRSYKATWQLRVFLAGLQAFAFQGSAIDWARDHRLHHKFNETDADPYNTKRGFFFSHMGWMFSYKHPEVINKGKGMDFSDLYVDPVLRFQKKYYFYIVPVVSFILPTYMPMYLWGETFYVAFSANILRYILTLNIALAVNSIGHRWGTKPYDKNLNPSENFTLSMITLGEGWHNYHHAFPWDYKTGELGKYSTNLCSGFIDLMAKIGWAYDLKAASEDMVRSRVFKSGDGSHDVWGWGDKDQPKDERREALRKHLRRD